MEQDYSKIFEYESIGKEYEGEKACISLTSWRARIKTVSKTLYSLLKQCPGFHIVLVLSKDEFPKKEQELPDELMMFVEHKLIEIFWIKPNYKSFKKVLFTMDKYRDVPIISADDDCIYTCNYAQMLYEFYEKRPNNPVVYTKRKNEQWTQGISTLYPPIHFPGLIREFSYRKWKNKGDDDYLGNFFNKHKIKICSLNKNKFPCFFHDEIRPINGSNSNLRWKTLQDFTMNKIELSI